MRRITPAPAGLWAEARTPRLVAVQHLFASCVAVSILTLAGAATAQPTADAPEPAPPPAAPEPKDIKNEVPLVGYTQSAFGASAVTGGGAAFGEVIGGAASPDTRDFGGGARLWVAPIDRLTLLVDVDKRPFGEEAAPSATAAVRIFGNRKAGWAVGGLLSYRTEGFAEIGGEVESAAMFSLAASGFHLDSNVVFGVGVEEDEMDGEVKLRAGYDVASFVRLGVDGRFRYRLSGDKSLPGDRPGDAVGGPEVMFGYKNFFMALGGGPSTVGISTTVGWTAGATIGGAFL